MGIVNDYISKLMDFIKKDKKEYNKPWLKYYGNMPENLNYFKGTVYEYLQETAELYPNNIACTYFGKTWTFSSFITLVDNIAESLRQFDVVENECVTMCLPNTPESFALFYAINKIGALSNIVHPLSSTQDIERALIESNSDILFCSDVSMPKARNIKVENFILIPTSNSFGSLLKFAYNTKSKENLKLEDNMISWETFMQRKGEFKELIKKESEDPAVIIYSGGTTGKTKGIILSNGNLNAMALQTRTVCREIKQGNSILSALPIFHVFGLALCCHTCLTAGMNCIIVPKLNTKKINKELKKYKPNILAAVPSMLRLSQNDMDPGSKAFKSIKMVVVGGDYLDPSLKNSYEKYLSDHGSKAVIKVGYGLSECCGFACCTAEVDEKDVPVGTIGIPNSDMDIKVFEVNSDIEKSSGDIGEICINGPTVMMGYINESEETKNTLVVHHDEKIWLHTGDLGYVDKNGFVFYSSRLKRMIISNGYNIYPNELESIINNCEYVSTCTVVGIPHKTKGQTPKVVIVLNSGVDDTIDVRSKIRLYCKKNLASYAVPTEFEYRKSLPVTAVGKVAYRDLEKKDK